MPYRINRLILILLTSAVLWPAVVRGKVEVGPYVQFTGPYTAIVRWDTDTASNSVVEYGDTASLGSSASDPASTTTHEVTLNNIEWKAKYFYRVNDGEGGYTEPYWFDNNINFTTVDCSAAVSPYAPDSLTAAYQAAADHIINQTGITKGFCLVYGCGEGRLAFELAKRSELTIIGVDEDIAKIDTAAEKLMAAGVYGARVKLRHVSSLSSLDFSKYFFNLIVSDRMISDGNCPGSAAEMFRVLRPSGGTAYLGRPVSAGGLTQGVLESWLDAGSLSYTTTDDTNGLWSNVVRGELAGAGWWSHQFGTPYNSGNSFDTMPGVSGTGDLDLQWTGRPGGDTGLDRHVRMPAPVAAAGRLFHQGFHRLMAMDSYNGDMHWSLEIPQLIRVNMPRDASNVCADDDAVYVAVQDDCWRLDGDTGVRTVTHKLNDPGHDWGCVFRYGDKLYGSATAAGASYTQYWELDNPVQGDYFYDSYPGRPPALTTVVFKVCSEYIFANDAAGNRVWTYEDGVIINTTICMGGGRVYFVESRNGSLKGQPCGQPEALSEDWTYENGLWSSSELYLVALDADTGTKLWDKNIKTGPGGDPVVVDGQVVFNLLFAESGGDELLVLECSNNGTYYLYTYEVSDSTCNFRWTRNHGWAANFKVLMKRPVIVGDIVYLHPNAYYLSNGNINRSNVPQSACGIMSAIGNTLCGRFNSDPSGDIEMWDISSNTFSNWAPLRQGCWISVVSGGNMVLAPEAGGACSCQMYFQTSVGFVTN
jgi:hypothetical protein